MDETHEPSEPILDQEEIEQADQADEHLVSIASGVERMDLHSRIEPPTEQASEGRASGERQTRPSLAGRVLKRLLGLSHRQRP